MIFIIHIDSYIVSLKFVKKDPVFENVFIKSLWAKKLNAQLKKSTTFPLAFFESQIAVFVASAIIQHIASVCDAVVLGGIPSVHRDCFLSQWLH